MPGAMPPTSGQRMNIDAPVEKRGVPRPRFLRAGIFPLSSVPCFRDQPRNHSHREQAGLGQSASWTILSKTRRSVRDIFAFRGSNRSHYSYDLPTGDTVRRDITVRQHAKYKVTPG